MLKKLLSISIPKPAKMNGAFSSGLESDLRSVFVLKYSKSMSPAPMESPTQRPIISQNVRPYPLSRGTSKK